MGRSLLKLGYPRILVLGDAMLDRYTWGTAERVSPEAPVLVLNVDEREVRLGGAASVAVLLHGLGAETTIAAVIGDDHDGRTIRRLIDESKINAAPLVVDPMRPTTVKERFLGRCEQRQPHQMLRVDTESRLPLDERVAQSLMERLLEQRYGESESFLEQFDCVLISDYAKGVCSPTIVMQIIKHCRDAQIPVLIDPGRGVDFEIYRSATLIKPNRFEAEFAIGHSLRTVEEAAAASCILRERFEVDAIIITLDRDGLVLATVDGVEHLPVVPCSVCDITGAGDTVLAALGLGVASGVPLSSAAQLANTAAGIQVTHSGVTPILRQTLLEEFQTIPQRHHHNTAPVTRAATSKLLTTEAARQLAEAYRESGKTIVFTNGCFDLLHVGHMAMLEESSRLGDILIVAINSDQSVRSLKGPTRPIISESDRARMVASLECVDHVLIFEDATPHRLLNAIRPDVLVKGGTTSTIVGREIVESYGGQVRQTATTGEWSTTGIVSQMQRNQMNSVEQGSLER